MSTRLLCFLALAVLSLRADDLVARVHALKYSARYDEALRLLDEGFQAARKEARPHREASLWLERGLVLRRMNLYAEAIEAMHLSLERFQSLGDLKGQQRALNDLGLVYAQLEQAPKAEACYRQALALQAARPSRSLQVTLQDNLACAELAQGRAQEALALIDETMVLAGPAAPPKTLSGLHQSRGECLMALGRLAEAEADFQKAWQSLRERQDRYGQAELRLRQGQLDQKAGRSRQALQHFQEAMQLAQAVGHALLAAQAAQSMAELHQGLGDPAGALAAYRDAARIQGQLMRETSRFLLLVHDSKARATELGTRLGHLEAEHQLQQVRLRHARWRTWALTGIGALSGLLALALVSRLKVARRLLAQEEGLRQVAARAPVGLLVSRGSRTTYVNDTLCDWTGTSAQAWTGQDLEAVLQGRLSRGTVGDAEALLLPGIEGKERSVEWQVHHLGRDPGELRLDLFSDITHHVAYKEALVGYQRRLASLLEEKTQALVQTQTQHLAQERLTTIGQLTATVAHELRTPLGVLRTSLFALKTSLQGGDTRRVPEALDMAERNILRCDRLVRELLDYTQPRVLDRRPLDLSAWVEGWLAHWTPPPSIRLQADLAPDLPVSLDAERFGRVLQNLLDNAQQALQGRPDGGTVTVHLSRGEASARLRIEDDGIGLTTEQAERCFEPLYTTKAFGFGLGLSVVRQIVEEHGGRVWAEPRPGGGATFSLELPLVR